MFRTINTARPDLLLPDGRRADSLRLGPLTAELNRLNIPGLRAEMGKPAVLDVYEAAIGAKVEAMRRNGSIPVGRGEHFEATWWSDCDFDAASVFGTEYRRLQVAKARSKRFQDDADVAADYRAHITSLGDAASSIFQFWMPTATQQQRPN